MGAGYMKTFDSTTMRPLATSLVDLVGAGAPQEEVIAAAQRVHRIMNRPKDPVFVRPREEHEHDLLNMLRMRGVEPTEDDMRDVRRLAALSAEDVEDAVEARLESDEICRRLFARTDSRS
jgi:hypothetical protein